MRENTHSASYVDVSVVGRHPVTIHGTQHVLVRLSIVRFVLHRHLHVERVEEHAHVAIAQYDDLSSHEILHETNRVLHVVQRDSKVDHRDVHVEVARPLVLSTYSALFDRGCLRKCSMMAVRMVSALSACV